MSIRPLLDGVVVVELASVLAGPSAGQFLAELGATVLKVETDTAAVLFVSCGRVSVNPRPRQ